MKALILNTGSELKKLLMKKKYLVLTVLGAIIFSELAVMYL